jgi:hypothetical protein
MMFLFGDYTVHHNDALNATLPRPTDVTMRKALLEPIFLTPPPAPVIKSWDPPPATGEKP